MQSSLGDIFCRLNISLGGFRYRTNRIEDLRKLAEDLAQKIERGASVFLLENNPLSFALQFLALLDRECIPICLQNGLTEFQKNCYRQAYPHFLWIEDGVLTLAQESRPGEFSHSYGCLTSGTTSTPEICYLSVEAAVIDARAHADSLGLDDSMRIIQTLPLFHSFGIVSYLFTATQLKCALDLNLSFLGFQSLARLDLERGVIHLSPDQARLITKEKGVAITGMEVVSIGGDSISNHELSLLEERFEGARFYATINSGSRISFSRINSAKS